MRVGFLGRFQPFHQGHRKVVEEYMEKYDEFKIVIGSADKSRERDNPLNLEERKDIIRACFPDIEILSIDDEGKDDDGNKRWIENLAELDIDAVISQNELVKQLVGEHPELELVEQKLYDEKIYSATEIRRRARSNEEWRYLVPDCAEKKIEEHIDIVKDTGIKYEFEPGWKRKNAFHGTE